MAANCAFDRIATSIKKGPQMQAVSGSANGNRSRILRQAQDDTGAETTRNESANANAIDINNSGVAARRSFLSEPP
jgi:hypothetical protein